jgi:hypothetical protein
VNGVGSSREQAARFPIPCWSEIFAFINLCSIFHGDLNLNALYLERCFDR